MTRLFPAAGLVALVLAPAAAFAQDPMVDAMGMQTSGAGRRP